MVWDHLLHVGPRRPEKNTVDDRVWMAMEEGDHDLIPRSKISRSQDEDHHHQIKAMVGNRWEDIEKRTLGLRQGA